MQITNDIKINFSLKKFNALTVAIYLSCQGFNIVLVNLIPSISGRGLSFIFTICFAMMIIGLRRIKINPIMYLCPVAILAFYGITVILFPGESSAGIIQILTYVILPFFLVQLEFDVEDIVKWTLIIFIPVLIFSQNIFAHTYYGGITMGTSYAFLPTIICAIAYVTFYAKKEKNNVARIFYLLLCLMNVYFLYELLFYGSRGPVLCIAGFIASIYFFREEKKTGRIKTRRMAIFVIIVVMLIILLAFGNNIFTWINSVLNSVGLNIQFFSKNSRLSQEEGILNGRGYIYTLAMHEIMYSPIFGHGIDMFAANTGIIYPHNFILQILYDGGLILFFVIIIPLIMYSIKIFRTREYKIFFEWMMFFCISVPGALFSGDAWGKYTLWFFIAYCVYRACINKNNPEDKQAASLTEIGEPLES